jgi:phosphocarrier protein FPr/phosphocarrier protein
VFVSLQLKAPLSGWVMPLGEVPDAVFADGLLGEGVAIDPTDDVLRAPCDGEVVSVAATAHAVTLRAANGAELLLHVGIDTVSLRGSGFTSLVVAGQHVHTGDALLRYDIDAVARNAPSLVTPVIVTNSGEFELVAPRSGRIRVGDDLLELRPATGARREQDSSLAPTRAEAPGAPHSVTRGVRVELPHGIHARPAALLVRKAREFDADTTLHAHGRAVSARSAVALLSLGVVAGDEVIVEARGPNAAAAVNAIEHVLRDSREHAAQPPPVAPAPVLVTSAPATLVPPGPGDELTGVVASAGIAVGPAYVLKRVEREVAAEGAGIDHETRAFDAAIATVRRHLEALAGARHGGEKAIVAAHLEFLDDPELRSVALESIANGRSAAYAWRRAIRASADMLRELADARLRERADDLLDLEGQVLAALAGEEPGRLSVPAGVIVLAADLLPSEFLALDPERIAGLCLAHGGSTSHVAIMASAAGLPALVAAGPSILAIATGTWLVLDGVAGRLRVDPPAQVRDEAERAMHSARSRERADREAAQAECRTADGHRIEIFANVGSEAEAALAVRNGAEGCGLLRTEFLFLERKSAPDVVEQAAHYQRIVDAFAGRPVVIRTLDAGGDKPIEYLPLPREENPALGLRGVRTSLWQPALLRAQLAAILRLQPLGQCRVMLPMISAAAEVRTVRAILDELIADLGLRERPKLGVMIETPAAAMLADQICMVADFVSIGTNDLTQYTLAMDRTNPALAPQLDSLHPAVLRLVAQTTMAAERCKREVAICGAIASDPAAAPLLVGLGVHELSVVPGIIARLKSVVRSVTIDECRRLAAQALELDSAAAVRGLLESRVAVVKAAAHG